MTNRKLRSIGQMRIVTKTDSFEFNNVTSSPSSLQPLHFRCFQLLINLYPYVFSDEWSRLSKRVTSEKGQ